MTTFLVLIIFGFVNCQLNKIDWFGIDHQIYDAVLFISTQDDLKIEEIKSYAEEIPVVTSKPNNCGNFLTIESFDNLKYLLKPAKQMDFIKDPCLTLLVIFSNFAELRNSVKNMKIQGQPYIFALNKESSEIFEIQFFSNKIVSISGFENPLERRLDFHGAKVRIWRDSLDSWIPFVENQFNFTTIKKDTDDYDDAVNKLGMYFNVKIGKILIFMDFQLKTKPILQLANLLKLQKEPNLLTLELRLACSK